MYEALRQRSETSAQCLAVIEDALCSYCDPDFGSGVHDGHCIDYCDRMLVACQDEFYDAYADAT